MGEKLVKNIKSARGVSSILNIFLGIMKGAIRQQFFWVGFCFLSRWCGIAITISMMRALPCYAGGQGSNNAFLTGFYTNYNRNRCVVQSIVCCCSFGICNVKLLWTLLQGWDFLPRWYLFQTIHRHLAWKRLRIPCETCVVVLSRLLCFKVLIEFLTAICKSRSHMWLFLC